MADSSDRKQGRDQQDIRERIEALRGELDALYREAGLGQSDQACQTLCSSMPFVSLDACPDPVAAFDPSGLPLYCNTAYIKEFDELPDRAEDAVADSLRAEYRELVRRALDGEVISSAESMRTTNFGLDMDVLLSLAPLRDDTDKVVGYVESIRDVTDIRMVETTLRTSHERYNILLETSPDPIVVYDVAGGVALVNPAFEHVFGWPPAEVLGGEPDFIPKEYQDETAVLRDRVAKGERLLYETKRRTADDRVLDMSVSAAPFINSNGETLGWTEILHDITAIKEAEEKLRRLATTDTLTGLCNRRRFMEIAERELDRAKRYGRPMSLLMCDVDHFKRVNDTYGHNVGDEVLKQLATIMSESLREPDVMARLGGEEFAAVLTEASEGGSREVAERLRQAVECHPLETSAGGLRITVSVGVATYVSDIDTVERLLGCADKALYSAKNSGRNQVATCVEPL